MFSRRTILSLFVLNILFGLGLTTYTISKRAHSSAMLNASIGDALMRNLPLVSADNFKPLPPSLAKILPQDNQSNHLSPRGIRLLKNGKAVGWFACTTGARQEHMADHCRCPNHT